MKGIWLLCIIGIVVVLLIAYNGKCRSSFTEGLNGGGRGGGGGGRGGGGRGGGGGGRGGGRGGGGWGGGGHHGGSWGGGGWGHHGGHSYGRRNWRGTGYWPVWWSWYQNPTYYIDFPDLYDFDEDPCNCFSRYRSAIDGGVPRGIAAQNLEACVRSTLNGGPCL